MAAVTSNLPIHGPNIPGSHAILFFIASDFTFTNRHIHNWALFPLWSSIFILSGAISPPFASSILDIDQPGGAGLIFQCHIFLPFQTVHGVLEARILEWFAIPFSSGPRFVRTLPRDSPLALHGMAFSFLLSLWLALCDSGFHSRGCGTAVLASSVCPLMDEDKRLVWASWWEGLAVGKTGSCSGGQGHAQ